MFQSVTDFWWLKLPTTPPNTEINAPNYGFVMDQQYFNDAIDTLQSKPIIITIVVIAIIFLFLKYRGIKKLMAKWVRPFKSHAKTDTNNVLQYKNSELIQEVLINQMRSTTWGLPPGQTGRYKTRNRKSSRKILFTHPSPYTQEQYEPPKRRHPRVIPTRAAAIKVKRNCRERKKVTETDTPQSHKQVLSSENQTAKNNKFNRRKKPPD